MSDTKHIKSRIRAVDSTRKITKAMEMIAAAKMQKSVHAALAARPYAIVAHETLLSLASHIRDTGNDLSHPLLDERPNVARTAVIVMAGNRGLCGGFHTAILRKTREAIRTHEEAHGVPVDIITIGKKADLMHTRYGYDIVATFPKQDAVLSVNDITPVSMFVIDAYTKGVYDRIFLSYTDYIHPTLHIPRVRQLLPVDISDERLYRDADAPAYAEGSLNAVFFEPNPDTVLRTVAPRLIETSLYRALLESNASEHAARMTAMRQASDAATEMKDTLVLYYNKARQESITAEIAEIAAAANALMHG